MRILKSVLSIGMDFYPEALGKIVVCNAPWYFTGVWSVIKTWLDERTRRKITVTSSGHLKILQDMVDDDCIPTFLGGSNEDDHHCDNGPWRHYELVDSAEPGAQVGVRRIDDPHGKLITPAHVSQL